MTTSLSTALTTSDASNAAGAAGAEPPRGADDTIAMLREQIDALDAALIQLVAERARVSRRIQTTRVNAGGTRVELGRERTVLASYRDGLGPAGPGLAEAILQVCRGAR
jgi:monofunctional chorismate mutase